VAGAPVELEDRAWEPAKARLAIYEAPEVHAEDMGLGRGWAGVTRAGEDITERVLEAARASVERFKATLLAHGHATLAEVVALAGASHPHARASERLALAERAVWELLHQSRLTLTGPDGPLEREQWSATLLRWESWTDASWAVAPKARDDPAAP
jgi:hypothetical protein